MSTIQQSYLNLPPLASSKVNANAWSSLQFSKSLKLAGFNDAQAELLSEEMNLLQHPHETVGKAELYQVFATKAELYQVRDELKSDLHQAEEKIVNKLCVRLGSLILACCSLCVALIGFLYR